MGDESCYEHRDDQWNDRVARLNSKDDQDGADALGNGRQDQGDFGAKSKGIGKFDLFAAEEAHDLGNAMGEHHAPGSDTK